MSGIHKWFPSQRASNIGFDLFFDIILLNKQLICWWFKVPGCSSDVTEMQNSFHATMIEVYVTLTWRDRRHY